ncbi:Sigma54 specific transcriptional regulator, Fis family [Candidatus Sulfopaludibacter sp. SbA4]|nr:Sigma54 specific transcriptional regulator, Fis family [Candidatus Sulfopaludibacter sp. SbA4]
MGSIRRLIDKASRNRLPVLLLGETGTGKEVVARAIHDSNPRGQFVPIDCGSLVGTLMESELFGHVKGSFSGAAENKKGLVELADGGTAFFDEIGDLPLEMQVKLLRLLQEREFRAVGSLQWRKVDLRIIAATHRDLKIEVAAGRFRKDLYYRLNVFNIHLPPLRSRKEDLPSLIDHFLQPPQGMGGFYPSQEVLDLLLAYDWPGNVRELQHCVERMTAMQSEGALQMADLPSSLRNHTAAAGLDRLADVVANDPADLRDVPEFHLAPKSPVISLPQSEVAGHEKRWPAPQSPVISLPQSEKQAISAALASTHGERGKAARILRIGRSTLYRKMKEYGIA